MLHLQRVAQVAREHADLLAVQAAGAVRVRLLEQAPRERLVVHGGPRPLARFPPVHVLDVSCLLFRLKGGEEVFVKDKTVFNRFCPARVTFSLG